MARATARSICDRTDLYQDITDAIIAALEAGRVPWAQPWATAAAPLDMPHNAATRARYSGINIIILWDAVLAGGYSTNAFLAFRQALALGGHVSKGERGTTIVYAKPFTPADECSRAKAEGRDAAQIGLLKRFTVFNTDQCDDLPADVWISVEAGPYLLAAQLPKSTRKCYFSRGPNRRRSGPLLIPALLTLTDA